MLSSLRHNWWLAAVFVAFAAANLYAGFSSASNSQYASLGDVFYGFMGGPIRLLLPLVVALLVTWNAAAELTHRHIASTRTRVEIRRHLGRRFLISVGGVFAAFFLLGMATWVCVFAIVPHLDPHVINAQGYGLTTPASVIAATSKGAPLAGLLTHGTVIFGVGAAAWLGVNAAVFAAVGLVAVYLVTKPFLALFVPFGIYLLESVVLQVLGLPGASFLLSAAYPGGLQNYPLAQAVIPTAALAAATILATALVLGRARTNTRFS